MIQKERITERKNTINLKLKRIKSDIKKTRDT